MHKARKRPGPELTTEDAELLRKGNLSNDYGLCRQSNSRNPSPAWHWTMRLVRQGTLVLRRFSDGSYGGDLAALTVARAYRDAVVRLIPPFTRRQVYRKLPVTNRSGVIGVWRLETGRAAYWQAYIDIDGERRSKAFSVKRYGEQQAKELAVAQRAGYEHLQPDRFATVSDRGRELAQAHFSSLLRHEQVYAAAPAPLRPATVSRRIRLLDAWFEHLRTGFAQVYMAMVGSGSGLRLEVHVRYDASTKRGNRTGWSLNHWTLQQALLQALNFVRARLTALRGSACWNAFRRNHGKAFMAFDGSASFLVRFRFDREGFEQHFKPPKELAALLPDFEVPRIPQHR
jgi:hypothetical protein